MIVVVLGVIAIIAVVALVSYVSLGGPPSSLRPAESARASLEPAAPSPPASDGPEATIDASAVPPCQANDLAMAAGGWGGATGSMAGGATLINVSIQRCRVRGKPGLELLSHGRIITPNPVATSMKGPVVVLEPGAVTGVITVWMNWCGEPPDLPLVLRLSLPLGAGTLVSEVWSWQGGRLETPRCDAPNATSSIGVPTPFRPEDIDLTEPVDAREPCTADGLVAFLGPWGAAAGTGYANVIVLNRSGFDCTIDASPGLRLRDADGKLLATGERFPEEDILALPSGRAAISMIGFANWCGPTPELPFRFELRIGDANIPIAATSKRSKTGVPGCNSPGATPPPPSPSLGYTGPSTIPGTSPSSE